MVGLFGNGRNCRNNDLLLRYLASLKPMKVTYYGHACFSVAVGGKTLLFDPFISGNPLAKAIDVKSVPADFILVSHGHSDHVGDAVEIARRTGALVIANYEVATWLNKTARRKSIRSITRRISIRFWPRQICERHSLQHAADGTFGGNPAASSSNRRKAIFISPATRADDGHENSSANPRI